MTRACVAAAVGGDAIKARAHRGGAPKIGRQIGCKF